MGKYLWSFSLLFVLVGCAKEFRPVVVHPAMGELPILFRFNSEQIDPEQLALIKKEAVLLERHQHLTLIVEGHTDAVGDSGYNLELGDRRARQVLVKLVEAGVDPKRLIVVSRGKEYPRESNRTRAGRDQNRRVEFVVRQ